MNNAAGFFVAYPDFNISLILPCYCEGAALKTYAHDTIAELMLLIRQGDEAAFAELYNRYWQRLYAIAWNRLQDKAAVEDIIHDVFTGLWANRQQVQPENPENYLAVAVKYAVFNRVKKNIREREKLAGFAAETPAVQDNIETALHHKQLLERVWQEAEKLPERCRLIFSCSREKGMPVKEIARQLGLSPKTVENQLGKALRQLKMAARSLLHNFF